jgi:hypothetical protein
LFCRRSLSFGIAFVGSSLIWMVPAVRAEMPFMDFAGYSYRSAPTTRVGTLVSVAAKFNGIQPNPVWQFERSGEYTVMVQGLAIASVNSFGTYQEIAYSGGSIEVHLNAGGNTTWAPIPPNAQVPSTFLNEDADLTGLFTELTLFYDTASGVGVVSGLVSWTGGRRMSGLSRSTGWTVFGGVSNHVGLGIPPGYDLAWDLQLYGPEVPNPVETRSWGSIKSAFLN